MELQILTCTHCGKNKIETEFHVCRSRKTGRQLVCKICQNQRTTQYREKTEGAYWKHKDNDPYYVYTITSPDGKVYVGYTATKPKLRWRRHFAQYNFSSGSLTLLHESFDKFGLEAHIFQVVDQASTKEKAKLREAELILRYKESNSSLNVIFSVFKVGQYDKKTGELINVWESINQAAASLKDSGKKFINIQIRSALTHPNRTGNTLGYYWKVLPFDNGYFFDPRKK